MAEDRDDNTGRDAGYLAYLRLTPFCASARSFANPLKFGGAEGDRTPDLRIANATLSQLSYGPEARPFRKGRRRR
jgi:hypothetical protein